MRRLQEGIRAGGLAMCNVHAIMVNGLVYKFILPANVAIWPIIMLYHSLNFNCRSIALYGYGENSPLKRPRVTWLLFL